MAWRAMAAASDLLLLYGGHDGSDLNHFDDPQGASFLAPHTACIARLVDSTGEPNAPLLRFGGCTRGEPPATRRTLTREHVRRCANREVLIHGLESRTDLNGTTGILASSAPNLRGRWKVRRVSRVDAHGGAHGGEGGAHGGERGAHGGGGEEDVGVKPGHLISSASEAPATIAWCGELGLSVEVHVDEDDAPAARIFRASHLRLC